MSEAACKAAACAGGCLDGIIVDNFRELTDVAVTLAANNQLSDEQLHCVIDIYTEHETKIKRRRKEDREARAQLKAVLSI